MSSSKSKAKSARTRLKLQANLGKQICGLQFLSDSCDSYESTPPPPPASGLNQLFELNHLLLLLVFPSAAAAAGKHEGVISREKPNTGGRLDSIDEEDCDTTAGEDHKAANSTSTPVGVAGAAAASPAVGEVEAASACDDYNVDGYIGPKAKQQHVPAAAAAADISQLQAPQQPTASRSVVEAETVVAEVRASSKCGYFVSQAAANLETKWPHSSSSSHSLSRQQAAAVIGDRIHTTTGATATAATTTPTAAMHRMIATSGPISGTATGANKVLTANQQAATAAVPARETKRPVNSRRYGNNNMRDVAKNAAAITVLTHDKVLSHESGANTRSNHLSSATTTTPISHRRKTKHYSTSSSTTSSSSSSLAYRNNYHNRHFGSRRSNAATMQHHHGAACQSSRPPADWLLLRDMTRPHHDHQNQRESAAALATRRASSASQYGSWRQQQTWSASANGNSFHQRRPPLIPSTPPLSAKLDNHRSSFTKATTSRPLLLSSSSSLSTAATAAATTTATALNHHTRFASRLQSVNINQTQTQSSLKRRPSLPQQALVSPQQQQQQPTSANSINDTNLHPLEVLDHKTRMAISIYDPLPRPKHGGEAARNSWHKATASRHFQFPATIKPKSPLLGDAPPPPSRAPTMRQQQLDLLHCQCQQCICSPAISKESIQKTPPTSLLPTDDEDKLRESFPAELRRPILADNSWPHSPAPSQKKDTADSENAENFLEVMVENTSNGRGSSRNTLRFNANLSADKLADLLFKQLLELQNFRWACRCNNNGSQPFNNNHHYDKCELILSLQAEARSLAKLCLAQLANRDLQPTDPTAINCGPSMDGTSCCCFQTTDNNNNSNQMSYEPAHQSASEASTAAAVVPVLSSRESDFVNNSINVNVVRPPNFNQGEERQQQLAGLRRSPKEGFGSRRQRASVSARDHEKVDLNVLQAAADNSSRDGRSERRSVAGAAAVRSNRPASTSSTSRRHRRRLQLATSARLSETLASPKSLVTQQQQQQSPDHRDGNSASSRTGDEPSYVERETPQLIKQSTTNQQQPTENNDEQMESKHEVVPLSYAKTVSKLQQQQQVPTLISRGKLASIATSSAAKRVSPPIK